MGNEIIANGFVLFGEITCSVYNSDQKTNRISVAQINCLFLSLYFG